MDPLIYLTEDICKKYLINTPEQKAIFLAQAHYESQGFTKLEENLQYSTPERLMEVFPSYFHSIEDTQKYLMNPRALANYVYANRMGNTMPNDGYNFRGRGVFQLTGRDNYNLLRLAENVDCLNDPDLLCQDNKIAILSGLWYWWHKQLYNHSISEVTILITGNKNPKTNGGVQRLKLYNQYLKPTT